MFFFIYKKKSIISFTFFRLFSCIIHKKKLLFSQRVVLKFVLYFHYQEAICHDDLLQFQKPSYQHDPGDLTESGCKRRQNTDRKVKRRAASAHSLTYTTGKSLTAEKKEHMQTFKTHVSLLFQSPFHPRPFCLRYDKYNSGRSLP